jgi:hypothetical protein
LFVNIGLRQNFLAGGTVMGFTIFLVVELV